VTLNIPTAVTPREAAVMVTHASGRLVLEVGALLGYSTITLARTALHVVSVDPHEGYPADNPRPTLSTFRANLREHGVEHKVTPVIGTDAILPMLAPRSFGMAFIDTTGEFEDTARIIRAVLPLLRHEAVLAVHDCGHPDWPGALEAVEKFSKDHDRIYRLTDRLAIFEGTWH
jgi:predicted O-methyltransferase YrrM